MLEKILIGVAVVLISSAIIGLFTLAFKHSQIFDRFSKFLWVVVVGVYVAWKVWTEAVAATVIKLSPYIDWETVNKEEMTKDLLGLTFHFKWAGEVYAIVAVGLLGLLEYVAQVKRESEATP